jgi:hypothetical protein
MTEIRLTNTDRILLLGESGGGKTFVVKTFLPMFKRSLVITPQHEEFKEHPNRIVTWEPEPAYDAIGKGLKAGNMMIVIDDSDILLAKLVRDRRWKYLIMGGRHRGVGWAIISRRTADIPTLIAKQANKLFLFQTDLPHDVDFLNEYYYPAGDEVKMLDITTHEFLYLDRPARTRTKMVV